MPAIDLFGFDNAAAWRLAVVAMLLCAFAFAAAQPVQAQTDAAGATVTVGQQTALGDILVGANGMTLYMFDNDAGGESTCYGGCAERWPPLLVDAGVTPTGGAGVTASLGVTERDDGTLQVTANNMPLYYWYEDEAPGDANGQAVGDVWWVLAPDGTVIRATEGDAAAGDTDAAAAGTGGDAAAGMGGDTAATGTGGDAAAGMGGDAAATGTGNDAAAGTGGDAAATGTGDAAAAGMGGDAATGTTEDATGIPASDAEAAAAANATTGTADDALGDAPDISGGAVPQQLPVTGGAGGLWVLAVTGLTLLAGGGWITWRRRR